jgi:hypothetical protein
MMQVPNEPIIEFNSLEEAYRCLDYWKRVLFLEHWIIKIVLLEQGKPLLDEKGAELDGQNHYIVENNCCFIKIAHKEVEERLCKYCAEEILVHELLHLKYNFVGKENCTSIEYAYYEILEHQLMEQISKSLVMAKYNLTLDWFRDFERPDLQ